MLTIFSGIVDPSNSIFHIKDISFILFVLFSVKYICFDYIYFTLFLFIISLFTLCIQYIFPDCIVDNSYIIHTFKGFIYSIIVIFMNKNTPYKVFKYFYYSVLILSVFIFIVWLILLIFPFMEYPLYKYLYSRSISIAHRSFLGLKFLAVNCGTGVLATVTLAFAQYKLITDKSKKYVIHSILFVICLLCSGTRANILAAILIVGFSFMTYLLFKKKYTTFVFFAILILFSFFLLLFAFLSEKDEISMNVKSLHLISYNELFESNILRYCFFGDGPGATFFSKGFGQIVPQTEWAYLDFIRNYGFINTIFLVLFYIYPLLYIYSRYSIVFTILISISYLVFMIVAGTNPYLINSVGFTVYACFVYISKNDITKQNI